MMSEGPWRSEEGIPLDHKGNIYQMINQYCYDSLIESAQSQYEWAAYSQRYIYIGKEIS